MVSNSLENPTKKRLRTVFAGTFSMIFCAIMVTGFCGWLTFSTSKVSDGDLIIFRDSIGESDHLMTIGRFILVISLIIFGGLRIGPMKPMIFKSLRM